MNTPAVSVVIPTVRLDEHFRAAVRSVLDQEFTDFELVVVLDGVAATDSDIPEDARISVVQHASRLGTPRSLNDGIAASSAPLIARLDADDIARPDRLALQVGRFAVQAELVALGSSARVIDLTGAAIGTIDAPVGVGPEALLRRNVFVHSSTMFRREALIAVGGYDERCTRMQDYDLWLRLCTQGDIDNLPEQLVDYRVHPDMHSRATSPFGPSARRVRAARLALASQLGRPRTAQHLENAAWTSAQLVRHLGLRRPRYLASVPRGALFVMTSDMSIDLLLGGQLGALRNSTIAPIAAASGNTGRLHHVGVREGVSVHELPFARRPSPIRDTAALIELIRLLRRVRPAMVVYGTPKASLLTALAAAVMHVPHRVHVLHGLRLETLSGAKRGLMLALERLTTKWSTATVAVSRSLRTRAAECGIDMSRARVLGAGGFVGVDVDERQRIAGDVAIRESARRRLGAAPDEFVIGFVGRLNRDKGIEELVRATTAVRAAHQRVRLVLIGADEGIAGFAPDVRGALTESWITVTGDVADPSRFYAGLDAFAFPTHREGLPTVLLEAAATDVPIVATDATGVTDLVEDNVTGLLVPVGNVDALASALRRVVVDAALRGRLVANARRHVAEHHARPTVWQNHRRFYESLLSQDPMNDPNGARP